jgi:hypothetical protein
MPFFCVNIKKSLAKTNEREKEEVELVVQKTIVDLKFLWTS